MYRWVAVQSAALLLRSRDGTDCIKEAQLHRSTQANTMNAAQQVRSIDQEIIELEKLIALQQLKVQLLRKKNDLYNFIDAVHSESAEDLLKNANTVGTLHHFSTSDNPAADSDVLVTESPTNHQHKITIHSNHDTLSRISAILANERTYLAWTTTALAAVRTGISFLGLTGITVFGDAAVYLTSIGFGVVGLWMVLQGSMRYLKLNENLKVAEPSLDFDQVKNLPVHVIIIILLVIVIIANSADQWSK